MHQFSFDFGDPFFDLGGWQVGLQVITFENVYGLDPELTRVEQDGGCWTVTAEGLTWAGGQRRRARRARLRAGPAAPAAGGGGFVAGTEHDEKVRCLKLILRGLPAGNLSGRRWESGPVPPAGTVMRYPFAPQAR